MAYKIPYAPFERKQIEYIRRSRESWLNVAEGGKRAGKNIINLLAWAAALENHPDKLHLAAGVSLGSAKMNILDSNGFGLQYLFHGRCRQGQYLKKEALYIHTKGGNKNKIVIFAGGDNIHSAAYIKGNTYGTAYITEANECHQTFVQEVMDRTISSTRRQVFFDLNPKPPRHWFYADFLDYQDELKKKGQNPGYNYEHFTIADNLSLSTEMLAGILSKYDRSSVWYKADILGQRTASSGAIYTGYNREMIGITPEEIRNTHYNELAIGIDVGGTDATVATLIGFTPGFREAHLISGYYRKQGMDDRMSESRYCEEIIRWLTPLARQYPQLGTIYVDSAAKLFRRGLDDALRQHGMSRFLVRSFDKSDGINQRIELNMQLMAQKTKAGKPRFRISTAMDTWHEAYQMAVWDQKAYEKGEWVRLDDGSYPIDCLDSTEYGFYSYKRYLERE